MRQYEDVLESDYYEKFKTIVEFCKAKGINFATMCTVNVDMTIKILNDSGKMSTKGSFKDGTYFQLSDRDMKRVDNQVEGICLATHFLSLSSNKLHSQSRQEFKTI